MANSWQKAYVRRNYRNKSKGAPFTPLGESNLTPQDAACDEMDDRILYLNTTKADQSDLLTCVASIGFNPNTGILTITLKNGSATTIDTGLSKLAINFDYDEDPTSAHYQQIIMEMKDGTYKYIDLSALITQFEFTNTSTITWVVGNDGTVQASLVTGSVTSSHLSPEVQAQINGAEAYSEESEAWANGQKQGTDVPSTAPQYENNSKYYSESAEAWSQGTRNGVAVPSTDPTYNNNAKYWNSQAASRVDWKSNGILGVKNLIPFPYKSSSGTWYGITRNIKNDGKMDISGTATANTSVSLIREGYEVYLQAGVKYKFFSNHAYDATTFNASARVKHSDDTYTSISISNEPVEYTAQEGDYVYYLEIWIGNGVTVDTVTDYWIMLTLADDLDNTYQPYAMTNRQLTENFIMNTFSLSSSSWAVNSDSSTSTDYPYVYTISSTLYSNDSIPIWDLQGAGTIPTAAEKADINLILEAVFSSAGIKLYATAQPQSSLTLRVRGV